MSPAQLQLFTVLDDQGTTVSELARRMGVTRQTAHQAVHGLIAAGLLEQTADPASARQRLIRRTVEAERTHRQACAVLEELEEQLATRIGQDAVQILRTTLETPWGPALPPDPAMSEPQK